MSNLLTPADTATKDHFAKMYTGNVMGGYEAMGEHWYPTKYTTTHIATGKTMRECWAVGRGDAIRLYVTADGEFFID